MKLSDYIAHRWFPDELKLFEETMINILSQELFETMPGFIQWDLFESFTAQDTKSLLKTLVGWLNDINLVKKDEQMFVSGGKSVAKSVTKRG